MATASNRANLVAQLRRNRTSSPQMEEYATATSQSFDAARDAIHSTAQIPDYTTQQQLPQQEQYQQHQQYQNNTSDYGSEGSADMSIELGRGVKRAARDRDEDVSSNAVFQLGGGDSMYELTGTPPIRSRNALARKADDGLRRQASVRQASETVKTGNARRSTSRKQNTLTDALNKVTAEDEASFLDQQPATATFNTRNTRFSRARQTSFPDQARGLQQQTPRHGTNNGIVSNSFILPDLPNITELVSGVRKDGTPVFNRAAKSRSRFASGSHKPARAEYHPVESVPVPDEEKAIYSSLQVLQARLAQLEDEKEDVEKRAEEYEGEIIDLRTQLATSQGRPDSGLGSEDEGYGQERQRLRASIKSLQERFDRSERKLTNSEITCKRITNERDQLLQQIGVAYYNIEDLKQENEGAQNNMGKLQTENQELKEEVDELRKEIQGLRSLAKQTQASYEDDSMQRDKREADLERRLDRRTQTTATAKDTRSARWEVHERKDRSQATSQSRKEKKQQADAADEQDDAQDDARYGDLESRVAEAVAKARRDALAQEGTEIKRVRSANQQQAAPRSRSRPASQQRSAGPEQRSRVHKRAASAPQEPELSDAESTTQLDFSRKPKANTKRASLPSPVKAKPAVPLEEDSRDLTMLTWQDPAELINLRKTLEEERRAARSGRTVSAPADRDATSRSAGLPRKSSMRDVTAGLDEGTGRFSIADGNADEFLKAAKSVRVQSPHTSDECVHPPQPQQADAGDTSILSNTSRRRRRAESTEGMTSAFILPDITLHSRTLPKNTATHSTSIPHDRKSCTACLEGKDATIPTPTLVTDREIDPDVTSATVRPAEEPALALNTVIKQLEDEIRHLKLKLAAEQRVYQQHDPALSKRRRLQVHANMDFYAAQIDKRSDQVYRLHDVLLGQKQDAEGERAMSEQEVEDTLESVGIDPAGLSGRVGRGEKQGFGLDGAGDEGYGDEEEVLGFSDGESIGAEFGNGEERRRRSGIF